MIEGRTKTVDLAAEMLVLRWAVKTPMVLEPSLPSPQGHFKAAECALVRRQKRPPASTVVFFATIEGPIPPVQARCTRVGVSKGQVWEFDLHFHTLQIGTVVLQVVRQDPPPADFGALQGLSLPIELQPEVGSLVRVWPPVDRCAWPPRIVLNWDAFNDHPRLLHGPPRPDVFRHSDRQWRAATRSRARTSPSSVLVRGEGSGVPPGRSPSRSTCRRRRGPRDE